MVPDYDTTVTGLRRWTKNHDPHVRAAVELLIEHDFWLHSPAFRRACAVSDPDGTAWIKWDQAREFVSAPVARQASSSQKAILDLAVTLGEDRFRLSRADDREAVMIVRAVARALDMIRLLDVRETGELDGPS